MKRLVLATLSKIDRSVQKMAYIMLILWTVLCSIHWMCYENIWRPIHHKTDANFERVLLLLRNKHRPSDMPTPRREDFAIAVRRPLQVRA